MKEQFIEILKSVFTDASEDQLNDAAERLVNSVNGVGIGNDAIGDFTVG